MNHVGENHMLKDKILSYFLTLIIGILIGIIITLYAVFIAFESMM